MQRAVTAVVSEAGASSFFPRVAYAADRPRDEPEGSEQARKKACSGKDDIGRTGLPMSRPGPRRPVDSGRTAQLTSLAGRQTTAGPVDAAVAGAQTSIDNIRRALAGQQMATGPVNAAVAKAQASIDNIKRALAGQQTAAEAVDDPEAEAEVDVGDTALALAGQQPAAGPVDPVAEARRIIGQMPLYDAAECYPRLAWRIWESTHPRDYDENSEEFAKKLDIFKSNAAIVRRRFLKSGRDPQEFKGFNNVADAFYWDKFRGGAMIGPYAGRVEYEYPPYDGSIPCQQQAAGFNRA